MKIEIQKERETPLLWRRRVTAMVEFEGATPSRKQIQQAVAKKLDANEKLTIIKHVYPRYGDSMAKVIAHVYSKEEDKNTVEAKYLLKKHAVEEPKAEEKPAEAAPAAETPAEPAAETPAEAPAEEKKDESS